MKSLTYSCLICALNLFCSKIAQKGKICSRLLEPQKYAPSAKKLLKSCRAQSGTSLGSGMPTRLCPANDLNDSLTVQPHFITHHRKEGP